MELEEFLEELRSMDPDILLADGFEDAIIGTVAQACGSTLVCYDYGKCGDVLMKRDGMNYEDAVEWMEFNVVCAYFGERTPMFLHRMKDDES